MRQRMGWILTVALAACLDTVGVSSGDKPRGEHLWLFHIAGGPYAEHIQLVSIGDQADPAGRRVFRPLWSRAWDGSSVNDFADVAATALDAQGLSWTLRSAQSGQTLGLDYTLHADTAIGALTLADGTKYRVFGVRFDSAAVDLIAPPLPPVSPDLRPVVLIRLDDVPASDRDFLRRLAARHLPAEIAVPTRFLGRRNQLTWVDLQYWRAAGMGVVMHSRYHLATNADAQHFIGETVGGFAEMAAHGFASHVFVQPGTWRDSIYFDSPAKLRTWRGALLRTFATVSECYAYPYWTAPTDSLELGLSHVTISDGASDPVIRAWWAVALRPRHATVILVHTLQLKTPGQLDWFLDLVADANARGVVRTVGNSESLFFPSPLPQPPTRRLRALAP
jgi:hypothetical protein